MTLARIVVTGSRGAGKTSFIKAVSDMAVIASDRETADHSRVPGAPAIDFGKVVLGPDLSLYLFSAPEESFDLSEDLLLEDTLGYVIVVDRSDQGSLETAARLISQITNDPAKAFVVALNRYNPVDTPSDVAFVKRRLGLSDSSQVIPTDVRENSNGKSVLLSLLYSRLEKLEASEVTVKP